MSLGLIRPGVLTVGIDASPPPPLHIGEPDSVDFRGFEVDLMAGIAGELGLTVKHRSVLWLTYCRGEVDAAVDDSPIASWFVREVPNTAIVSLIPDTDAQYALMLAPDNVPLRKAIDNALSQIRQDGRYAALHARWFGGRE